MRRCKVFSRKKLREAPLGASHEEGLAIPLDNDAIASSKAQSSGKEVTSFRIYLSARGGLT